MSISKRLSVSIRLMIMGFVILFGIVSIIGSGTSNPGPVSSGPKTNAAQGDIEQTFKLLDAADKASNKYNFNNSSDRAAFELEMYNLIKQGQYIDLMYKGNAVILNPTSRTDSVRRIQK